MRIRRHSARTAGSLAKKVTFVIVIVGLVVIGALLVLAFGPSRIVPEDRRLVIDRNGRFNRLAGPGRVRLIPGLESVRKEIEVRDHPKDVTIPGIFAYGLPNEFKLNLWCKVDLEEAVEGDRDKLVRLVQLTDAEREAQVEVLIRQAIVDQVTILQEEMPLPKLQDELMDKVIALAPGSPRNQRLLEGITEDLDKSLPTVGVILNREYPIKLTKRGIPTEMVEALDRTRGRQLDSDWLKNYALEIKEQFPEVSNAVLAQMLASLKGVDTSSIQGFLLEQDASDQEANVRVKAPRSGPATPNVGLKPSTPGDVQPESVGEPEPGSKVVSSHLTKRDLSILKRIPRQNNDQRRSA